MQKKHVWFGIICAVVICFLMLLFTMRLTIQEKREQLLTKIYTVECGTQIKLDPRLFVDDKITNDITRKDLTIVSKWIRDTDRFLFDEKTEILTTKDKDYLEAGEYSILIRYKDKEYSTTLIVEDTKAPEFIDLPETLEFKVDEEVDWNGYFEARDYSDFTIEVEDEELNLKAPGDYMITVRAEDCHKNKVEKTVKVKVVEEEKLEKKTKKEDVNPSKESQNPTSEGNATEQVSEPVGNQNSAAPSAPEAQPSAPPQNPAPAPAPAPVPEPTPAPVEIPVQIPAGCYDRATAAAIAEGYMNSNPECWGYSLVSAGVYNGIEYYYIVYK